MCLIHDPKGFLTLHTKVYFINFYYRKGLVLPPESVFDCIYIHVSNQVTERSQVSLVIREQDYMHIRNLVAA